MATSIVVAVKSSEYFAKLIAEKLGTTIYPVIRKTFGGGEKYLRLDTTDRMEFFGKYVIIVGSTATDEDYLELCHLASAIAKYGARRLIFVIPFFGYSTMERAVKPGEVVTAKICARQLSQLPQGDLRNCFLLMDCHTAGLVHYFEGECLRFEIYAESILNQAIKDLALDNFMFASADMGRPKWVEAFARTFDTGVAFIRKQRDFETTKVLEVIGDVTDKNVIIYDDMIRSGGTLIKAAEAYLKKGALSVCAVASHGAFNDLDSASQLLLNPKIKQVIVTNSHPITQPPVLGIGGKLRVMDVSGLFLDAISKLL